MRVVKGTFNTSRRPISQIDLKSRYGNFEKIALGLTIMSIFYQIHLSFRNEVRESLKDFKQDQKKLDESYQKNFIEFKQDQKKLDESYQKIFREFKQDQKKLDESYQDLRADFKAFQETFGRLEQEVTTGFQRMEMLIKEVRIEQKEQARELYSKPSN